MDWTALLFSNNGRTYKPFVASCVLKREGETSCDDFFVIEMCCASNICKCNADNWFSREWSIKYGIYFLTQDNVRRFLC